MTKKQDVDLNKYKKHPRLLEKPMEAALGPGGALHPILAAVANNPKLRLDIRDRRFNVYYGGGNLMLVDGRKSPWALSFDEKYFKGGALRKPDLPGQSSAIHDANATAWVQAFPDLIAGMEDWWTRHPKGERAHCQAMATANSGMSGSPPGDYLILDLEYQYAQRRFDMIAAKRRPTEDDAIGWEEPDLVFIEVKSALAACHGKSGLRDHARDYQDIIAKRNRQHVEDIKKEYKDMIAQKSVLGLLDKSLGFKRFSPLLPKLLLVFVDLDLNAPGLQAPLHEARKILGAFDDVVQIPFMKLNSKKTYVMSDLSATSVAGRRGIPL
ncbi:MAG: hypothetical protein ACOYOS_00345 [Syntrophales bacterium]